MEIRKLLFVLLLALVSPSCTDGYLTQRHAFLIGGADDANARIKVATSYEYTDATSGSDVRPYYLYAYAKAYDEDTKKRVRDEIIFEMMAIIDEEHGYSMDKQRRYRGHAKIASKLVNVGTHVATAASPGAQAVSILSAIGAGATSMEATIDSSYLQEASLRAIFSAMEAEKIRIKQSIVLKCSQTTSHYPLQAGFTDLKDYWEVGFLHKGVSLLEQKAAAQVESLKAGQDKGAAENVSDPQSQRSISEASAVEALKPSE